MSVALLLLPLLAPPQEIVLVVDGFVVGSRTGARWKPAGTSFAKTHSAMSFVEFGIGQVKGSAFRKKFVVAEEEQASYVENGGFDERSMVAGLKPKVPRPVVKLAPGATYEKVVRSYLARRGVSIKSARITGVWRTDLDGDGSTEVLIEAGNPAKSPNGFQWPKGSYAMVLLRSLKNGRVVETPLEFNVPDKQGIMETYRLRAVADVDGDGRMEILTTGRGYEWNNAALWGYRSGTATRLLQNGAGH